MDSIDESAVEELGQAGRTNVRVDEIRIGDTPGLANSLKSITGGKVSIDRLVVVRADGPTGLEIVVLPKSGSTPLPGELHTKLDGALRGAVAYDSSARFGTNWHAHADDELATWMRGHDFDAGRLPNDLKHGLTSIDLPWTVQAFPIAADRSWIAFQLGGYGGLGTVGTALEVLTKITPAIAAGRATGPAAPMHSSRFGAFAQMAFTGELDAVLAAAEPPSFEERTNEFAQTPEQSAAAIPAVLSRHAGKRVLVDFSDQKKVTNISKKVAPGVETADLVGFVATDLRGAGKAGFAFTADTVHIADLGDRWSIPYVSIRSFRGDGDKVLIDADDAKPVKVLVGRETMVVVEALAAATGRVG